MKLNPFDLAALDQEIRHELSRITRDVKSQARSSPGIRGWKRMAAWRQTLNTRRQIGDAVPILGEVQRLFARPARFRLTWGPVGQHVTVRPFDRISRHPQKALIGVKRVATHLLPECWKIG